MSYIRLVLLVVLTLLLGSCANNKGAGAVAYQIEPSLDGKEELEGLQGGPPRAVGVMVDADGHRDEFVVNEVVMAFAEQSQLDAFLRKYNGRVLRTGMSKAIDGISPADFVPTSNGLFLIQVDLDRSDLDDLDANLSGRPIRKPLLFSSKSAARLAAILAREDHLRIGPNVVLRGGAINEHRKADGTYLNAETWPWMTEDSDALVPGDQGLSVGVTHAWEYLRYFNVPPLLGEGANSAEWTRAYVAIIDGGFALDERTGAPLNGNTDVYYYGSKPLQVDMVDWDGTAGGRNRTRCTGGASCPWHGQSAFSVIAAQPANRFGSAGVAGPVVIPIFVKVDWTWYGAVEGMYTLADAIRASVVLGGGAHRADVISISIYGSCFTLCALSEGIGMEDFADYMQRTVQTATAFGAIVTAAAGNESQDIDIGAFGSDWIPCELENVICVGAVGGDGLAKSYSNYGSNVDIWAPTDILVTTNPDTVAQDANDDCSIPLSNTSCDELSTFGGTSAAAPFVAGVVALMVALDKNSPGPLALPSAGVRRTEEVRRILRQTANPSPDFKVRGGYVDAYRAVAAIRPNQPPLISIQLPANGASVSWRPQTSFFKVQVIDPEPGASSLGFVGRTRVTIQSNIDGQICSEPSKYAGQTLYLCDRPRQTPGQHEYVVVAEDPFGGTSTAALSLTILNHPPTAQIQLPATGSVFTAGQVIQFQGYGTDADEPLSNASFLWNSSVDGLIGTGRRIERPLSVGSHTVTLTTVDGQNSTATNAITVQVQAGPGRPSAIILQPLHLSFYGVEQLIIFEGRGVDVEDGNLSGTSMSWYSSIDGFLGNGTVLSKKLSGPPPTPCESNVVHAITLIVRDSDGNEGSQSFQVKIGRIC